MPTFRGKTVEFFSRWVAEVVKYPENASREGISGRINVGFVVDKFGMVTDVTILGGSDLLLNTAALEAVNKSPLWRPGFEQDTPVMVRFTITVNFIPYMY
jgi:protein TonB